MDKVLGQVMHILQPNNANLCLGEFFITTWLAVFFLHERDPSNFALFNERSYINSAQCIATNAIFILQDKAVIWAERQQATDQPKKETTRKSCT